MVDGVIVYTRDISSGKIHKRTLVNGSLQSFEQDNLDDAGAYDVISWAELDRAEAEQLCDRCFPHHNEA